MKNKATSLLIALCFIFLFSLQLSSNALTTSIDASKRNYLNSKYPLLYGENENYLSKDNKSQASSHNNLQSSSKSQIVERFPVKQNLKIEGAINDHSSGLTSGVKLAITVSPSTIAFRGDTITVTGQLKSSLPGDYWNGETVKLYYNVTESQFLSNKAFYENNPSYYVGSDVTSGNGDFSIDLQTSTLSSDPFSKIGQITLFTWFDGDPSLGRGAGSPGSANVTFYGTMEINVISSVNNPNSTYSFTTQIKFDNGTTVATTGTSYHLKITWQTEGVHTDTNYTFAGSPPSHTYSNTAPVTVDTVTYEAYYDISQLSFTTYFTEKGTTSPTTDKLLYYTFQNQTKQQVIADAYFISAGSLTKVPIEGALGSYIKFYANLSDETGLKADQDIIVSFRINNVEYANAQYTTNSTGEIQFLYFLNYTLFTDIRKSFTIVFSPNTANFSLAIRTSTTLTCYLAVNITSITVSISNPNIYYTPGQNIQYEVTIQDEYGRSAPGSSFQVQFPGLTAQDYLATDTGDKTLTTTIPNYTGVEQTQNKTILVLAQSYNGGSFRYVVSGSVQNTTLFDVYYTLSLTLLDPNNSAVSDGSTRTVFNNTFYNEFLSGSYNLSVLDQWGRFPLGATISITFYGKSVTHQVNSTHNWVVFDLLALQQSGLNLSEAHTGLTLVAHSGSYIYQSNIQQTINIYGPDNTAPTITTVTFNPDPFIPPPHEPFFNITFTILATDIGTGVRYVVIWYTFRSPDNSSITGWINVTCTLNGTNVYVGTINATFDYSQWYVLSYVEVKDYAGWGLNESGLRQETPQYNADFGFSTYWHSQSDPLIYLLGDYVPPIQERVPSVDASTDTASPYANITVYVNDSLIYSGIKYVEIVINVTNVETQTLERTIIANMTNIPGTNQWFYLLNMSYNYNYTWYYIAYDSAYPTSNVYQSSVSSIQSLDTNPPTVTNVQVTYNGTRIEPNDVLLFTAEAQDTQTGVQNLTLIITYFDTEYRILMEYNATTNLYVATFDLSSYPQPDYGETVNLRYYIRAYDNVNNSVSTAPRTLSVYNEAPVIPPGGGKTGNIGAIVGGVIAGIVVILIGLFLWYYRHSIRTYARRQTMRRKLQDYLQEILAEIRQDGVNGRYKDGLLKVWRVIEGIGREFYNLPRYKFQTPLEFGNLLAEKSNIDKQLMFTIISYFEKARYGHEKITENDYNAGVRALHNIIARMEVGEMEIES